MSDTGAQNDLDLLVSCLHVGVLAALACRIRALDGNLEQLPFDSVENLSASRYARMLLATPHLAKLIGVRGSRR
ncbi:MAG: hypothetical protein ACJ8MR_03440 [Povalibacter sp.]